MGTYTIIDENGQKATRRGKLVQNEHGLYYFVADYNRARRFDSVSRYRMSPDAERPLIFADYRRKRFIDDAPDQP